MNWNEVAPQEREAQERSWEIVRGAYEERVPAARHALDQLMANWHAADPRIRDAVAPLRRLVDRMP